MDKFFNFQEKIVRYRDYGSGKCIVFLHGFTESLEIWDDLANQLSENFRIITLDLPGHGKTSCFSEVHTMKFMTEVVNAVVEFCNISKFLLVGHSMGGYVSLEYAVNYPDKLAGLGLFHSHAFNDDEAAKINRDRVIKIIKSNKFDFLNHFIPDLFKPENRIIYKEQIDKLIEMSALYMKKSGIIASLEGMKIRNYHNETLINLECPMFYIIGKHDSRIEPEKVVKQAMLPAECWIQIIDTGHMGYIEAKEQTFSFIKKFAEYIF